ncbi:DUF726 domain-containing protein [Tropicimonas sp. S265A]|uniref:DUF726 domain-containing protein n=1 Tax=Tropicimonas sp. S265A TaxID=3415134 RepID=UPI003C7B8597
MTALGDAAREIRPGAPIVVLLHGYRYDPARQNANPHTSLYAVQPEPGLPRRQMSWLEALGFLDQPDDPGLCLAVGWSARCKLADAYDHAAQVGTALADLLNAVAALMPGHPIKLMAHSLGARVALSCLRSLKRPVVKQAILLAPAEFTAPAQRALRNPAAQATEILQISPLENWLFDALLVRSLRHKETGTALGQRAPDAPNWISLSLGTDGELAQLAALGHRVAPRKARVCHWSAYLRGGLMEFYADLLSGKDVPVFQTFARSRMADGSVLAD